MGQGMSRLVVTLAGAVTLRCGDDRVGDRAFTARQLRLVTAMLVLERGAPVPLDVLADALWSGLRPDRWRAAVRVLVSQVRDRLSEVGRDRDAIVSRAGAYVVQIDPVVVDIERAVANLSMARQAVELSDVDAAGRAAGEARSVLSRPLLSGVESAWAEDLRDRMARQHLDTLVVLGRARTALGAHDQARRVLAEAVELDPLREDGWRALMRAEVAAGNAARALAAYERCRIHLADELGVDPSGTTQRLHGEILQAVPVPSEVNVSPVVTEAHARAEVREPYVGLRTFDTDDAEVFFGRDAEVQALVDGLTRHDIVAVVGPSGVGKSSLVRAGLLPALAHGAIPDADTWPTAVVVPGAAPLRSLAAGVAELAPGLGMGPAETVLRAGEDGLARLAMRVLDGERTGSRLLVVVDQFEEVFMIGPQDEVAPFMRLLEMATTGPASRVSVVVTLRADFYDLAASHPGVADLLSSSQFVVPPLSGDQVEDVVVGPARHVGMELEPGLLGRIVADVANEPGALPLLQHLLFELWQRRIAGVLTRGAYEDLGGVPGALAGWAEGVYAELGQRERAIARRVLLRGIHPAEDGTAARRPIVGSELVGRGADAWAVDAVVARLVDARLLTSGRDDWTGAPTVELAHEALIDGWPRLRDWVDESRRWLLVQRRLTVAAQNWAQNDRHDDWLLAGLQLDEAHELLLAERREVVDLQLSPLEHELVDESLAARDRDHAAEVERRERERRLEQRSVRRLRALVVVGLVVAVGACALWWTSRAQTRASDAQALTAAANQALATDPQLALLLGLEAADRVGAGADPIHHEVAGALHSAVAANRVVARNIDVPAPMAFAPDRSVLVARRVAPEPDGNWAVEIRDVESMRLVDELTGLGGTSSIADAAFSGDGNRLAVEASDGIVTVWNWRTGERWQIEDTGEGAGGWVSLSEDGRYVVRTNPAPPDSGLTSSRPLEVWDVETGRLVQAYGDAASDDGPAAPWPSSGHFHPTEPRIALLHVDSGVVEVVDLEGGGAEWRTAVPGLVWAAWSPDGRWVAVAGDRFVLLDGETGEQITDIDRTGEPSPVEWSLDSRQVSIGSSPRNPEPTRIWTVVDDDGPIPAPEAPTLLGADPLSCALGVFGPDATLWETSPCGDGLRQWDLAPDAVAEVAWLAGSTWPLSPLAFSPDGAQLAATDEDGGLGLYDAATWDMHTSVAGDRPPVVDLAYNRDGSVLAAIDLETVTLWDTATWEPIVRQAAPEWGRVTVSPDGDLVAWSSIGRTAGVGVDGQPLDEGPTDELVWIVDHEGREVASLGWGQGLEVQTLDFSPDGEVLAIAASASDGGDSPDNGTVLWDWRADQVLGTVDTQQEAWAADFDPTGRRLLVTAGPPSNTAEIWDVSDALAVTEATSLPTAVVQQEVVLEGHDQHVRDAQFSPDATMVATCGRDGTARLWDATSGRQLQWVVTDDLADGCTVAFSPDGNLVAVADPDTGTWMFAVHLEDVAEIAAREVVRPFTIQECRDLLDLDACPT